MARSCAQHLPEFPFLFCIYLSLCIPSIRNKVTFKAISEKLHFPSHQTPTPKSFPLGGDDVTSGNQQGAPSVHWSADLFGDANPAFVSRGNYSQNEGFASVIQKKKKKPPWRVKQINDKSCLSMLALVRAQGGGGMGTPQP